MESITFQNIIITNIPYQKMIDIRIEQMPGEHARAVLQLEAEEQEGCAFAQSAGPSVQVEIKTSAAGQPPILFCGVVQQAVMKGISGYPVLEVTLLSESYLLDLEPKSATFQQTTISYEELMKQIVKEHAAIQFEVSDKPTGGWNYQNQETDWAFLKRLSSQCGACIVPNIVTKTPVLTIGVPRETSVLQDGYVEYTAQGGAEIYQTNEIVHIGADWQGKYVCYVNSCFQNGVFKTSFMVNEKQSFRQERTVNQQSECRMLSGIVQEVEKEKVKVFFDSIDSEYDARGDNWFEYATPFATNGGAYESGIYQMPEVNDRVRVFLPAADEGAAFAFGAVSVSPLENTRHAKWRVPGGQEILMTEEGIKITCADQSIYIDMNSKEDIGIKIFCDKPICLDKAETIEIDGKEGVAIFADNQVQLKSVGTMLAVENERIVFNAEQFHIN